MQPSVGVLRLLRKSKAELRQAKAALKGQSQALAATASLLSATPAALVDGIVVVDLFGRVVVHNQNFARLWQGPAALLARGDAAEPLARGDAAEPLAHWAPQGPDPAEFFLGGTGLERAAEPAWPACVRPA